jgi:hypothetical protein
MPLIDKNNPVNELDFSLDACNEQKVYTGAMAYAHKIKNLLFMRPGDLPSMPDVGINIQSYRFKAFDTLVNNQLREKLSDQVSAYVTDMPVENIDISVLKDKGDFYLLIKFSLMQDESEVVFGIQQRKGEIVNFNFEVYDNESVEIW